MRQPACASVDGGNGRRLVVRVAVLLLLIAAVALGASFWFWRLSSTERSLVGAWMCTDQDGTRHQLQMRPDRSYGIVFRNPEDQQFKSGSSGRWRADSREIVFSMERRRAANPIAEALNRLLKQPDQTVMAIVELTDDRLVTRFVETGVEWEWSRQEPTSHALPVGSPTLPQTR